MWPHTWILQLLSPVGDRILFGGTSRTTAKAGNVLTQAYSPVCYNVSVFQSSCGPCAQVWLDGAPLSCLFGCCEG
jgi:hypothetical protein